MSDNDHRQPVLTVHLSPDEASRTPNSPCAWVAEAEIDGVVYTVRSRHGAPNALFRQLVAAGIADSPAEVRTSDLRGVTRYPSFHLEAQFTYTEGAARSIARVRYREYPTPDAGSDLSGPAKCPEPAHGVGKKVDEPPLAGPLGPRCRVTPKSDAGGEATESRPCAVCGRLFRPWRPQAMHCSSACRQKAYRLRAAGISSRGVEGASS